MDSAFKNNAAFPPAYRHPNFGNSGYPLINGKGHLNGFLAETNGRFNSADKKERFYNY